MHYGIIPGLYHWRSVERTPLVVTTLPPCMLSLQSCPTLCTYGPHPPGPSVHGILQGRILEWVAISSSRESSQPRDWTHDSYVSCFGRRVVYHWPRWYLRPGGWPKWKVKTLLAQLYRTLCDPMDCSPQTPLSTEFSRQEYWSGLPFPSSKGSSLGLNENQWNKAATSISHWIFHHFIQLNTHTHTL